MGELKDPLREYTARRSSDLVEQEACQRNFVRLGNWRLAIAAAALVMAFFSIARGVFSSWWLLMPIVVFVALVVLHFRVVRRRTLAERGIRFYERGIARLSDRWIGTGNPDAQFLESGHIYAEDLDVFGKGSLFELTATVRTASGEQTLADWFRTVAARAEAVLRQDGVRELANRLDLREDLALLGEDVRAEVRESSLAAWGSMPAVTFARYMRVTVLLLAIAATAMLGALLAGAVPIAAFAAVLGCNFLVGYVLRKRVKQIVKGADTPGHDLRIFSLLLQRMEREEFEGPGLQRLRGTLDIEGLPASKRIAQLERWMDALDSSEHLLVRLVQPAILWREQAAMAIEA